MSVASMTKCVRRISFVAMLLLSVSLSVPTQAASPLAKPTFAAETSDSTHDDGSKAISNGDFINNNQCTLQSWAFSGNTTPYLDSNEECIARLDSNASTSPSGATRRVITRMSQTFIVPDNKGLYMDISAKIRPESDLPNTQFAAQTINLYDAKGGLIYSKSRNSNSSTWLIFNYQLGGYYANQQMTLEFQTVADPFTSESPGRSKLYVDKVGIRITIQPPIPNVDPTIGW